MFVENEFSQSLMNPLSLVTSVTAIFQLLGYKMTLYYCWTFIRLIVKTEHVENKNSSIALPKIFHFAQNVKVLIHLCTFCDFVPFLIHEPLIFVPFSDAVNINDDLIVAYIFLSFLSYSLR